MIAVIDGGDTVTIANNGTVLAHLTIGQAEHLRAQLTDTLRQSRGYTTATPAKARMIRHVKRTQQ